MSGTVGRDLPVGRLPNLWEGERRSLLLQLIGTGLLLAVLAGLTALFMTMLLGSGADVVGAFIAGAGLLIVALGIGGLRALERVLAERLGQHYVQQIRLGLVRAAITAETPPPPGITIARATNDLTSVRNWVSSGIAPLAVGLPLILGATLGLALLHPFLGLAALVPLLVLALLMTALARPAFERAKAVRRRRGRLASLLADTVAASAVIRAASGERREVRRIGRAGQDVVDAAVARARIAGCIRGVAAGMSAAAVAAVGIIGLWQAMDPAVIAGALTIVGVIATPVGDLGRVVEYRQNFRAARRILGPALAQGVRAAAGATPVPHPDPPGAARSAGRLGASPGRGRGVVSLDVASACACCPPPALIAAPGDTVLVEVDDPARADEVLAAVLGLRSMAGARVRVDGEDLLDAGGDRRRELAGYAAAGSRLERGTIARAVRYRRPDIDEDEGRRALERMGLSAAVEALGKGERTQLRRGGEPLSVSERARLLVARAAVGDPPLLVLDRIDTELDDDGVRRLDALIEDYPGVVLIASGRENAAVRMGTRRTALTWRIGCVSAGREVPA